jgi:hypothetical protein
MLYMVSMLVLSEVADFLILPMTLVVNIYFADLTF